MASNRPRDHRQGAPLKPPLHAQVSSLHQTQARPPPKTPVSRRLAPDTSAPSPSPSPATSSSSSLSSAVFRPKLAADPSFPTSSATSTATSLRPSPTTTTTTSSSSTVEAEQSLLSLNVTPRSSSRKSRVDSNHSTPQDQYSDDTPSHAKKRPHMTSPTNSEPPSRRAQVAERPNLAKAKSLVGSSRPVLNRHGPPSATSTSTSTSTSTFTPNSTSTTRPTVRGYVNTKGSTRMAVKSPAPPLGSHLSARPTPRVAAATTTTTTTTPIHRPTSRNTNRETKSSSPMFFRANETPSQPTSQGKAPPSKKSPAFFYANGRHEEHSARPRSLKSPSPVLSAVSDNRSPHLMIHSPSSSDPLLSPPLSAVSAISALSSRSPYFPSPALNPPSVAPSTSPPRGNIHLSYRKGASQIIGMGGLPMVPTQRKTSLTSVRTAHNKTNSLSTIDSASPALPRRHSQSTSQLAISPSADGAADDLPTPTPPGLAPPLPIINTSFDPAPEPDFIQSPTKSGTDMHAEARRERKVLDLEISNSSLLAINKSLEREIRKQKAELKRFRRLSRAGQFAVPEKHSPSDDMSTLEEETDLPAFDHDDHDGHGPRPSSPFLEEPAEEDSDDDSTVSSADPLSPSAQADKDAARRTEDENHLRLDLSRHRELLLDTQRMNQSLQRCLYQTEGLIKDGKKALDYQVASSDVKLGGHILSSDDFDDNSSLTGYPESVNGQQPDNPPELDRRSVGSEMDSGIDFGKRGPLTMSRSNPHYTQPS